ncbi:MAG: putative zinc-binding protein [Thermoleophilia bacterium]|nr:putative zinc-binding protein [Thermoleophilia bacterium]
MSGDATEGQEVVWEAGKNTHENIIYSCFGGMSNTGVTAALASLEVVKTLGLQKVAIGCLGGLPTQVVPVYTKTAAADRVVTVDGCPFECGRKVVEQAGFEIWRSLVLTRDIGMTKKPLNEDVGQGKGLDAYILQEEVAQAKEAIIAALAD